MVFLERREKREERSKKRRERREKREKRGERREEKREKREEWRKNREEKREERRGSSKVYLERGSSSLSSTGFWQRWPWWRPKLPLTDSTLIRMSVTMWMHEKQSNYYVFLWLFLWLVRSNKKIFERRFRINGSYYLTGFILRSEVEFYLTTFILSSLSYEFYPFDLNCLIYAKVMWSNLKWWNWARVT